MQSKHLVLGTTFLLLQGLVPTAHAIEQTQEALSSVPSPQSGVETLPLTLEQAVKMALSANPGLRSATRAIGIADGAVLQAGTRPNPELSVLSEGTDRNTRTETTQINQVIELGGKRSARIAVAEQERNIAISEVAARRAELRADVITAYMDALTAQERVTLAQASLDLAHKSTDVTSRRVTAGKISPVEQTRSSIAEAAARLELTQAEADLALARRRLTAFWASPRQPDRLLIAPDAAFGHLPAWPELAARLEFSPQLRRAQSTIAGRDAQVALERAQRIPDLTVTVGSQRERELGRRQGVIGLSVPLPLFNRNQGNTLSALRRADQARDDLEAERVRLNQALADAYQRAEVASAQTVTLRDQVLPAAQSAYDAAVTGFELGKFGFTDVLDAQRTLFQTKAQYLRALADRYRSVSDIERYVPNAGTTTIESTLK
jgi:cobalt-zinc-cadmium efflux system outer membrane protein